jgi:hypothetical protein
LEGSTFLHKRNNCKLWSWIDSCKKVLRQARLQPGIIPKVSPHSGKPRKTTDVTDRLIKREATDNPWITASELKENHPGLLCNVSIRTIQHRLQRELDLPSKCAVQKPLLTKQMVRK